MSVKINKIFGNFTTTPNGMTIDVNDNSMYAATTSFVKSFISTFLILINTGVNIIAPTTIKSIFVNGIRGNGTTLTLRGNVSLGTATTPVRFLGTQTQVNSDYPYILSCNNTFGQKVQGGYISISSPAPRSIVTPVAPTGTSTAFCTTSVNSVVAVSTTNTYGFDIYPTGNGETYWLLFQT